MTTLPAGPASSPVVQLLYWVYRPIPFMEDCARRFGDVFTVRFPANPPFVFFSHPDAIRDIFTADPDRLRAGEANRRSSGCSAITRSSSSTARGTSRSGGS